MTIFTINGKVISVSLFGSQKKYLIGSIKLADSVARRLHTWHLVFYVGQSVPLKHERILASKGATIIRVGEPENLSASAWRFRAASLGEPGWVLFRDADSIVSRREASAIGQWVNSGLTGHLIRDHPFHSSPIMAGLWGLRPVSTKWFHYALENYSFSDHYGSDQEFLAEHVYPRIVQQSLIHTSFHHHETQGQRGLFEIGNSRWGTFCGESVTSNIVVRTYARLHRLFSPRICKCAQSN
jgi:hypothetical protein